MDELFTKFYSEKIKEIHDFLNSDTDILYITGFSGSGKSSVLKNAIKTYDKDILNFHHLCFKGTVADDFLLSFYDTFRDYALSGKIALKKNPEEGFMEKVSFYFRNLELPSVVVIDNFESTTDEEEITDFLIHIAGFNNVKVVIISKNPSALITNNPTISLEKIIFDKINLFEFEEVLTGHFKDVNSDVIESFYEATGGYELYLKMALTYISSSNIGLSEFMEEYKEKEIPFEEFMIEKEISLIPNNYYPILQNLSLIYHNIRPEFIENYSLGDIKLFPYLISKFAITEFFGTYYIKSYLRKYFAENLSLQDKISICNKLISIYENELTKSPKDRILRLSRESIRKQIVFLNEAMPKVAKINSTPSFNYVAQAISNNPQWFVTQGGNKNLKGLEKLKKEREMKIQAKKQANEMLAAAGNELFNSIIKEADNLEKEYRFKEAIDKLKEAMGVSKTAEEKINIYFKIVHNAIKLNDNNLSLSTLRELSEFCINEKETDNWAKARIETGGIYKKLYAFSRAKNCFEEIIKKENGIKTETLSKARLSLGEIYELENNFDESLKNYQIAFDLIAKEDEKNVILPEICYKTGNLYDENEWYDEALFEYSKGIEYSKTTGNEAYLVKCCINKGVILSDKGEYEEALENLKEALNISNETGTYLDTYYIARNIAEIYKITEPEKSYEYLELALEYARLSENSFEIAISLIELGDYYYNLRQNEQALICYFQAKTSLGASCSKENMQRILTRINDMKIKLGDFLFKAMKELYDPE